MTLWVILGMLGAFLCGYLIGHHKKYNGRLIIDDTAPKPIYRLEFCDPIDDIPKKKDFKLKVVKNISLSQTKHSV